jgi:hypothetical protein
MSLSDNGLSYALAAFIFVFQAGDELYFHHCRSRSRVWFCRRSRLLDERSTDLGVWLVREFKKKNFDELDLMQSVPLANLK